MVDIVRCRGCAAAFRIPPNSEGMWFPCTVCKTHVEIPAKQVETGDHSKVVEEPRAENRTRSQTPRQKVDAPATDDEFEVVDDAPAENRSRSDSPRRKDAVSLDNAPAENRSRSDSPRRKDAVPETYDDFEVVDDPPAKKLHRDKDSETDDSVRPQRKKKGRKKKRGGFSIDPMILKLAGGFVGVVAALIFGFVGLRALFAPELAPEIPDSRWAEANLPNRCKAMLPGSHTEQTQQAAGIKLRLLNCEPDKNSSYGFGYTEGKLPPNRASLSSEQLLNDTCDGSFRGIQAQDPSAKELSRTPITLGEYPGMQLVVKVPRGDGQIISRVYLVKGRLYMVIAGGRGLTKDHPNTQKLFNSFQLSENQEEINEIPPKRPRQK